MTNVSLQLTQNLEARCIHYGERPIDFETFLGLSEDNHNMELVNGILEERMAAQLEHEKLEAWLLGLMGAYVEQRGLGIVLGSRTAVEINVFGGRLPDLLFVSQERLDIVQEKAVYGAPDLIVEIISPHDRPSHIITLETEYRSIGVAEIVLIDPQRRRIRILRHTEDTHYAETLLTSGDLQFTTIEGLVLQAEWILKEPRPTIFNTLTSLLSLPSAP